MLELWAMPGKKPTSAFPRPVWIQRYGRSPIGKFGGALSKLPAPEIAARVLKKLAEGDRDADFVYLGHARQAGARPNPARQALINAGLSQTVPAVTVNQACASGLTAVVEGAKLIGLSRANTVWAGGVEAMSQTPYLLPRARFGFRLGHAEVEDGMHRDGFFCPLSKMLMGETVERYLIPEFKISREEQDAYALESQQRAARAWKEGRFAREVLPFEELATDEHVRGDTTREALAKLPGVFGGSITAGTSSGITDGAAWLRLSASQSGSVAQFIDYEIVALEPQRMGVGPVSAIQTLLKRQELSLSDIDAFEINEAFAAQVIACQRTLKIPGEKLNAWGGAIALGHPIGASGARVLCTLLSRLNGKPGALGIAALCVSGGQGIAALVQWNTE